MKKRLLLLPLTFIFLLASSLSFVLAQSAGNCGAGVDYFAQADSQYDQRDYAGAVASYTCAIQADPENADAINGRGNAQRQIRAYSAAIEDYTSAIEINPGAAIFYNNRGWTQFLLGNYSEALEDLNLAIEMEPDLAYAYNNRGQVYAAQGQYELAAADYDQAITLRHDPISWPQYNLSLLPPPFGTGTTAVPPTAAISPTALPATPTAEVAVPDTEVDYLALARAAYRAGNYEEAIAAFTRAIEIQSESAMLYGERAKAAYMMGNYRQAIQDYEEALELRPNAEHYTWRGNSYTMFGDNTRALADFDSAIALDAVYLNAYVFRSLSYVSAGNATQSLANLEQWQALAQSRTVDQALPAPGQTAPLDFSAGRIYRIIFEGQAGQALTVETLAPQDSATDTFLMLVGPRGLPIVADDDSGDGLNAALTDYRLSESGGYTLFINYAGSDSEVDFALELSN